MRIGVPTEIKTAERRVGLTPASVVDFTSRGHDVLVQAGAGEGIGATDLDYVAAGASIAPDAAAVFGASEMIIKVKEPQASERAMLRRDHTLFTYLHLASDPTQTAELLASGATCIAYETVTGPGGGLPLLAPMSAIAGRLATQAGATTLTSVAGGPGILIGGVPGVAPAKVTVLGGGVVGTHAIEMAVGLGADVTVLDRSQAAIDRLAARFGSRIRTIMSSAGAIDRWVVDADLTIGAVLIPGAAAPKLVTEAHIAAMRPRSVVVDVAIDQGGCFATSRPTTHTDPTYVVDGIVHYCVANMPGAVPRTATEALNNATLAPALKIAELGTRAALLDDVHLRNGLNVMSGQLTEPSVAIAQGLVAVDPLDVLGDLATA